MNKEFKKISLHNHINADIIDITLDDNVDKQMGLNIDGIIDFIDNVDKNGFNLLAITNSNCLHISTYLFSRMYAKSKGIELLPGVELNLKYETEDKFMHVVVIFNPEDAVFEISKNIQRCLKQNNNPHLTLSQFVKELAFKKCIIIPHGIKQNRDGRSASTNPESLSQLLSFDLTHPILIEDNKSFHTQSLIQGLREFLSGFELVTLEQLSSISAIDRNRSHNVQDPTYLWGECVFDNLYYSSLIGGSRFIREKDIINKSNYISRIEVLDAKTSEIKESNIFCSHGLNSIIGSSGSGKTLLLNYLYKHIKGEKMEHLTSSQGNYDSIYDNSTINLYDMNNKLIKKNDLAVLEGTNLYDSLLKMYTADKNTILRELNISIDTNGYKRYIKRFNTYCNNYILQSKKVKSLEKEIAENLCAIADLEKEIDLNKDNAKEAIKYSYEPNIESNLIQLEKKINEYNKDKKNITKLHSDIVKLSNKYEYEDGIEAVNNYILGFTKHIENRIARTQVEQLTISKKLIIIKYIESVVKEYNEKTGKAGNVVVLSTQKVKEHYNNIFEKVKKLLLTKAGLFVPHISKDIVKEVIEKGVSDIKISKTEVDSIKLKFEKQELKDLYSGNISEKGAKSKLAIGKFKNDTYDFTDLSDVKVILDTFSEWDYESSIALSDDYNKCINMTVKLRQANDVYSDITKISAGELGKIYFEHILVSEIEKQRITVLFFDQPENNLEKKFILEELSYLLTEFKHKIQIFITTHEALLVINADSNNIIVSRNDKNLSENNNILYSNVNVSSFENKGQAIRTVSELIDGSCEAVTKRSKVYGGIVNENRV